MAGMILSVRGRPGFCHDPESGPAFVREQGYVPESSDEDRKLALFLALWLDAGDARRWPGMRCVGWLDAARRYGESDWHDAAVPGALVAATAGRAALGLAVRLSPSRSGRPRRAVVARAGRADLHADPARLVAAARCAQRRRCWSWGCSPSLAIGLPHLTLARSASGALLPPLSCPRLPGRGMGYALVFPPRRRAGVTICSNIHPIHVQSDFLPRRAVPAFNSARRASQRGAGRLALAVAGWQAAPRRRSR